ncbi:MAG: response regulator [Aquisalinus sp.]|nr:response regulator [Aquisalinus sp.]
MAKILLIEDDKAVADSLSFVLQRKNHEITHATNTISAKHELGSKSFDCAFIDVWLGEEDGLEFLADNGELFSETPFIVISGGGPGRTLENVTARADAYGAVRMLFKPFEDTELLDALSLALESGKG